MNTIHWFALALGLGGMLGMVYAFGRASLRREIECAEAPDAGQPRDRTRKRWWARWLQGVSVELVGAVITAVLLGFVASAVQQAGRKDELILQMGNPNREYAMDAVRILRIKGWINDGSLEGADLGGTDLQEVFLQEARLQGVNLHRANLQGADLSWAKMQGADLQGANLRGAILSSADLQEATLSMADLRWVRLSSANLEGAALREANLQGAFLCGTNLQEAGLFLANLQEAWMEGANLQGAYLGMADLQGANLQGANLEGANLGMADLQGTNLQGANLKGAEMESVKFSERTRLPDGTYWTPGTDVTRFTDPDHPDFWRGYGLSGEALTGADFSNANLEGANLSRANLEGADLSGANLQGATFDRDTTLPDGTPWTRRTDMTRFTDPDHPDFWRSDDPDSPAYRGDADQPRPD